LYRGRIGEAEPLLTKAYDLHRENNNYVSAGLTLAFLAAIAVLRGKLRQAEEMSKRAIQMSGPYTERPGGHVVLGWVYYIWNDLAKASIEFERATELSVGSPWMTANNILNTIPIKLAQGDIQAATITLEEVERGWSENFNAQDRATIAGYQMVVAEATGDDESVSRWLDKFCEYSGFILMIPTSTICLLHERGHEAGKRRLRALYETSRKENLQYYLIIERINQAISSSESEEALSLISNASSYG